MNIIDLKSNDFAFDDFTKGELDLYVYLFKSYISSCSCYLMDQRLNEKKLLYDGLDGFIPKKKIIKK